MFFAVGHSQPLGECLQQILHLWIVIGAAVYLGYEFGEYLTALHLECVTVFGLLFIFAEQVLCKNILGEGRTQSHQTFFREIALGRVCRVDDHVDMGMVAFIMKSGKPTEVAHRYPQVLRERLRLRPEHISPSAAVIIAEAFGVLSAKRYDCRPYISRMHIEFVRHLLQIHRHAVVGKKSVRADAFRTGTGGNVVGIGFCVHHLIGVFFKHSGNKFRSRADRFLFKVVLILQ